MISRKEIRHKIEDAVNTTVDQFGKPGSKTKKMVKRASKKISDQVKKELTRKLKKEKKAEASALGERKKRAKEIPPKAKVKAA